MQKIFAVFQDLIQHLFGFKRKLGPDKNLATGPWAEKQAAEYLKKHAGHRLLTQNFRISQGEIDIISMDGSELVFTEVKCLRDAAGLVPEEKVNRQKKKKILKAAQVYLHTLPSDSYESIRFDIIAVQITGNNLQFEHLEDAFRQEDA